MSKSDHPYDQPEPQVRVSRWAYMAPLALGSLLALSAVSLFVLGWIGGTASGERVLIEVQSDCSKQWAERIGARGASIGLGTPELSVDGPLVRYVATLPGHEDDREKMPALLTQTGGFEIYQANEHGTGTVGEALVTSDDILDVSLSLDARGHPFVDLEIQPHAAGRMQGEPKQMLYFIDGQEVDRWLGRTPFQEATVRIQPRSTSKRENMRQAVDWNIVLRDGPAPCAVDSIRLSPVEG